MLQLSVDYLSCKAPITLARRMRLHRARKLAGLHCLTLAVARLKLLLWSGKGCCALIARPMTTRSGMPFIRFWVVARAIECDASQDQRRLFWLFIPKTLSNFVNSAPPASRLASHDARLSRHLEWANGPFVSGSANTTGDPQAVPMTPR